jgi:hypothetical protein
LFKPEEDIFESILDGLLISPHLESDDFFHIVQGVLYYVSKVLEISQTLGLGRLAEDL